LLDQNERVARNLLRCVVKLAQYVEHLPRQ